jgi:hypothetical protein
MLTVREAAARIKRPNESLDSAVNRLRNWTALGFVPAAGEKNPGSGHKRQYDGAGLLKAVVLQTLSDIYHGAPIAALIPMATLVARSLRAGRRYDDASKFFIMGEGRREIVGVAPIENIPPFLAEAKCDSYVLISIGRILERAEIASPKSTKRKGKD